MTITYEFSRPYDEYKEIFKHNADKEDIRTVVGMFAHNLAITSGVSETCGVQYIVDESSSPAFFTFDYLTKNDGESIEIKNVMIDEDFLKEMGMRDFDIMLYKFHEKGLSFQIEKAKEDED